MPGRFWCGCRSQQVWVQWAWAWAGAGWCGFASVLDNQWLKTQQWVTCHQVTVTWLSDLIDFGPLDFSGILCTSLSGPPSGLCNLAHNTSDSLHAVSLRPIVIKTTGYGPSHTFPLFLCPQKLAKVGGATSSMIIPVVLQNVKVLSLWLQEAQSQRKCTVSLASMLIWLKLPWETRWILALANETMFDPGMRL